MVQSTVEEFRCLHCGAPTDSYLCEECEWYYDRWYDEDFLDEEEDEKSG